MEKLDFLQYFELNESSEFPIVKPIMDDGWFCCLQKGQITVNFNYKEYTINVDNDKVYFFVPEGIFFSLSSSSTNCNLQVIAINHTCLTWAYPYLGTDANLQITYALLLTTKQIDRPFSDMLIMAFHQLELSANLCEVIKEYEKLLTGQIVYTLIAYYNAISHWREEHGLHLTERLSPESQTQSYQIMNNLAKIFDEPESMHHRDVRYYANRLNISVRYFFNVCKHETGMTPKDFINDIIICEMKHTLLTTNLSLQQLTIKYAFSDQSALTQYFRRNTGMTPTDFRRQNL